MLPSRLSVLLPGETPGIVTLKSDLLIPKNQKMLQNLTVSEQCDGYTVTVTRESSGDDTEESDEEGKGEGGGRGSVIINIELHHGDFIFLQSRESVGASGVGSLSSDGSPPPAGVRRVVHQRLPLRSQAKSSPGVVVTVDGHVKTDGLKPEWSNAAEV